VSGAEEISLEQTLAALLRLAVAERAERLDPSAEPAKIEVMLAEVGLSPRQISALTGIKANTISQSLSRARRKN
jgi:DNA-directed RNA polymerase specialized sigma24 family protein